MLSGEHNFQGNEEGKKAFWRENEFTKSNITMTKNN